MKNIENGGDKNKIVKAVGYLEELKQKQPLAQIPEELKGRARTLLEDYQADKKLSKEDTNFVSEELKKLGLDFIYFSK